MGRTASCVRNGEGARMSDPRSRKPGIAPPAGLGAGASARGPVSGKSTNAPAATRAPHSLSGRGPEHGGRIVHDSRGNAVWDWVKETGRIAIESTSRLLKRLELPNLKTEEQAQADGELRLEAEREPGAGYDPYNQATRGRTRR